MKNRINTQIESLMKRKAAATEAVRAAKAQQREQKAQKYERLKRVVGGALLANAAQFPDFDLMLRGVLKTTVKEGTSDYRFLKAEGWL